MSLARVPPKLSGMRKFDWIVAALILVPGSGAQAQSSGCVRDSTGALQCTMQRSQPQSGSIAPMRRIPRADLSADALRRSNALVEQRRQLIEQQGRETDEQRARLRQDCIDRALANGEKGGCSL